MKITIYSTDMEHKILSFTFKDKEITNVEVIHDMFTGIFWPYEFSYDGFMKFLYRWIESDLKTVEEQLEHFKIFGFHSPYSLSLGMFIEE